MSLLVLVHVTGSQHCFSSEFQWNAMSSPVKNFGTRQYCELLVMCTAGLSSLSDITRMWGCVCVYVCDAFSALCMSIQQLVHQIAFFFTADNAQCFLFFVLHNTKHLKSKGIFPLLLKQSILIDIILFLVGSKDSGKGGEACFLGKGWHSYFMSNCGVRLVLWPLWRSQVDSTLYSHFISIDKKAWSWSLWRVSHCSLL